MAGAQHTMVGQLAEGGIDVRDLAPQEAPRIDWTVGADGVLAFRGAVEQVLGASPGTDLEAELEMVLAPILIVLRSGVSWDDYQLERTIEGSNGKRHLRIRCRCLPDGSNSHVGVIMDAADHRQVEEDLGDLIDRYRLLGELSPDMILVHQDGVLRYMNPTGLAWLGAMSPSDVVGRSMTDFVAPSSLAALRARIAELDRPGAVSTPTEMTLLTIDGRALLVESRSVRTTWDGRPAFQVFLRDHAERRRAEAAMRYQANLLSSVSDAVVATDLAGRITGWNPAAASLYQMSRPDAIGRRVDEVLGGAATVDNRVQAGLVEHRRADGSLVAVRVAVAPLRDEMGEQCGEVAVCADQTERMLAAAARQQAESRFTTVVTALSEGIMVAEHDGTISSLNPSARALLGPNVTEGSNVRAVARGLILIDTLGRAIPIGQDPISLALATGASHRDEIIGFEGLNGRRWMSVSCETLDRRADGRPSSIVCSITDVTERRAGADRLAHAAAHDSLTGLANRTRMLEVLDGCLSDSKPAAVLFVDLDRFKAVNDSHGHQAGDRVLRTIASRIRHLVEPLGTVGRLAGDEFLIVLPGMTVPAAIETAERISESASRPIAVMDGRDVVVSVSIGVSGTTTDDQSAEALLANADMAMYRAKQRGRACIEVFDFALRAATSRRLDLAERLRQAVHEDLIKVHYQPIVRFDSGHTVGYEALARWTDDEIGAVPPDEFIPIAEDHGLIAALGTSVLQRACREAAQWAAPPGRQPPNVSVNLSARQLSDPHLLAVVDNALTESGLAPGRLLLEVTETVMMDDVTASVAVLHALQGMGVHLVIDDFGTGYSSLNYLRHLPVDAMKIDRSFVADLGVSREDDAVVDAIIQLGHSLGLSITAEGVETAEQAAILTRLGCDTAQGWLYGRPGDSMSTHLRVAAEALADMVSAG